MEIRTSSVPVGETSNVFAVSAYVCQQMSEYLKPTAVLWLPKGTNHFQQPVSLLC